MAYIEIVSEDPKNVPILDNYYFLKYFLFVNILKYFFKNIFLILIYQKIYK
jgi:hypothetical protein